MDIPTKDRLYEALVARNMKAIDLSKATGLSRGAISQWLSGFEKRNRINESMPTFNDMLF